MIQANTLQQDARPGQDRASSQADEVGSQDAVRRAEEMVDRFGEQVGQYTAWLGHQLLRLTARAREEAEDIWAEAQSIRQGRQP